MRSDFGLKSKVLGDGPFPHPEQDHITDRRWHEGLFSKPSLGCRKQNLVARGFRPISGVGGHGLRLFTMDRTPDTPKQSKAIRASAPDTCLMQVRSAKP